jgi:hypothetical protein
VYQKTALIKKEIDQFSWKVVKNKVLMQNIRSPMREIYLHSYSSNSFLSTASSSRLAEAKIMIKHVGKKRKNCINADFPVLRKFITAAILDDAQYTAA